MKNLVFAYPLGMQAEDKVTGFRGTITHRAEKVNGSVQYGLQPRIITGSDGKQEIQDARLVDEASIILLDDSGDRIAKEDLPNHEEVVFEFDTGDKVRHRFNGFEGHVVSRVQHLNKCVTYVVEGPRIKADLYGMANQEITAWEQELDAVVPNLSKLLSLRPKSANAALVVRPPASAVTTASRHRTKSGLLQPIGVVIGAAAHSNHGQRCVSRNTHAGISVQPELTLRAMCRQSVPVKRHRLALLLKPETLWERNKQRGSCDSATKQNPVRDRWTHYCYDKTDTLAGSAA